MTTPATSADEKQTTNPSSSNTNKANSANKSNVKTEGGLVTVRLLAHSWQRRVPDTDPIEYKRWRRGDEFEITEEEFEALTLEEQIKPTVEKVDD